MRAPLPSKTHGPASFRGVIGPSCPFVAGTPLPGLGVRRACTADIGMGTGKEAAAEEPPSWERASVVEGVLAPSLSGTASASSMTTLTEDEDAEGRAGGSSSWGEGSGATVDRERSREALDRSAAEARARSSDVRIRSTDVLPASTLAGGSRRGSLDRLSSASSLSFSASSSFSSSQSSGSSTSASRSAAARQLGQMKMG